MTDFISSFKTDLARPSRFDVLIPPMRGYGYMSEQLSLRCENAELPGRTFMTHDQKIYGPTEKYPYQNSYNDITLTFIVSGDMSERKYFDGWMEAINPTATFNFSYKADYITNIQVRQYDVTGKMTYGVSLIDAYPIAINQLDLDWSSDGHHKLSVVFAYTYWEALDMGGDVTVIIPSWNQIAGPQTNGILGPQSNGIIGPPANKGIIGPSTGNGITNKVK